MAVIIGRDTMNMSQGNTTSHGLRQGSSTE